MSKLLVTRVFNPAHQRVEELRGSRALDLMLEHTVLGAAMEITKPEPDGRTMFSPNGVVFMDLSVAVNQTAFADDMANRHRLIVDVHFPVLDPIATFAMDMDGVISEDGTHEMINYWSRKDVQDWVKGFLHRVPVLTTPHRSTYHRLRALNRNVVMLPDVNSKKNALLFCKQFCRAMALLKKPDASTMQRIGDRLRLSIGWLAMIHELRKHIGEAVAKPE